MFPDIFVEPLSVLYGKAGEPENGALIMATL
jgi:hypothetical protein